MKSILDSPPRTLMEVYKMLPEGTLAELIDNVLYMSPSPVTNHQKVLKTICRRLSEAIDDHGKGDVIIAPFDIYLDEVRNAVQPDIVVILKSNKGQLNEFGHFHRAPDLIVEILSPGNRQHDTVRKKELYERFGVTEYWIVDPETRLATGYTLSDGSYVLISEETGTLRSRLLQSSFSF